jgi:hypothetical protein
LITTLVFEKSANFFAENCQKSQKIVIINIDPCFQDCPLPSFRRRGAVVALHSPHLRHGHEAGVDLVHELPVPAEKLKGNISFHNYTQIFILIFKANSSIKKLKKKYLKPLKLSY